MAADAPAAATLARTVALRFAARLGRAVVGGRRDGGLVPVHARVGGGGREGVGDGADVGVAVEEGGVGEER